MIIQNLKSKIQNRQERGFTLIELITSMSIFSIFMVIMLAETNWLSRASGTAGRGAAELCSATRFAEKFRNDVRQASDASIKYAGRAILLRVGDESIEYFVARDERRLVRWNETTRDIEYGPFMARTFYHVTILSNGTRGRALVQAAWECLAETDPQPNASQVGTEAPRVLVLDTVLRGGMDKMEEKP